MVNKKSVGCAVFVLVVIVLGIYVNFKPTTFPPEGQQSLDDFAQRFGGNDFSYTVISAQKGSSEEFSAESVDRLSSFSGFGGEQRPMGVCPGGQLVKETWCVIIDKEVETTSGDRFTHFIVQKQNQRWVVEGLPDSAAEVFQLFGCHEW